PVAPELRVVGRQEQQPSQGPLAELLDHVPFSEVGVDPPVRGDRPQVHDANVAARWGLLLAGIRRHSGPGYWGSRRRLAALITACREASRMLESIPTPQVRRPPSPVAST